MMTSLHFFLVCNLILLWDFFFLLFRCKEQSCLLLPGGYVERPDLSNLRSLLHRPFLFPLLFLFTVTTVHYKHFYIGLHQPQTRSKFPSSNLLPFSSALLRLSSHLSHTSPGHYIKRHHTRSDHQHIVSWLHYQSLDCQEEIVPLLSAHCFSTRVYSSQRKHSLGGRSWR
jgi:hypothetical protein